MSPRETTKPFLFTVPKPSFLMNVQYYAYLSSHMQTKLLCIHQHWSHNYELARDCIRANVHRSSDLWAWVAAWCLCETPLGFWNTSRTPKRFGNRQDCTTDQSRRRFPATISRPIYEVPIALTRVLVWNFYWFYNDSNYFYLFKANTVVMHRRRKSDR